MRITKRRLSSRKARYQPKPQSDEPQAIYLDASVDMLPNQLIRGKNLQAFVVWLLLSFLLGLWPATSRAQGRRPMTVRDSIEKVTFVQDPFLGEEAVTFSPDSRYFFMVTSRGVLASGEVESSIWLFDSAAVSAFLKVSSGGPIPSPRKLATMRTLSNGAPITATRWAADSGSIAFLGRNKDSERHLYVVTVKDGRVKQVSPDGHDVTGFDRAKARFVFTAVPPVTEAQLYESAGPTLPDIQVGTGLSIFKLLYPEWEGLELGGQPNEVWQARNGKASPVKAPGDSAPISIIGYSYGTYGGTLSLSPGGRYAVVTNAVAQVPAAWESYEAGYRYQTIVADKPGTKPLMDYTRPTQYDLIDLPNGHISPLIDAPSGMSTGFFDALDAVWLNEKEVILTNTFLPPEGKSAAGLPHSLRPWVVAVDVESRKITCIKETPMRDEKARVRLSDIEWQASARRLVLRYLHYREDNAVAAELFQEQNGTWTPITDPKALQAAEKRAPVQELSVSIRQSVNEPPVLVAALPGGGEAKRIWDPNPQFAQINFGEASVYHWRDKDGNEWTGGLVKPPDYVAGRRYPLVIQTHGFNRKEFLTDGFFPTASAARPMAARGMVVLQIGELVLSDMAMVTPKEPATMRGGYVAAIQQLDAEGLIDPRRVGIIGFSRSGWYVLDSLIHASEHFAAATLAECTYISFGEYTLNADYGNAGRAKSLAAAIGVEPFGEGLQKWVARSAGFNTDKINIPVLFEANSPVAMIYAWDIYALMRLQNKPVELLYFRNGEHVLAKPPERLASQEMNVDWYDFWLNGHEDPDPAKAEQYARWRHLREIRDANDKAASERQK